MQLFKKPTVWQPGYIHTLPAEDRKLWDKLAFGFFGIDQRAAGISTLVDSRGAPLSGANLTAGANIQWRGTPYGLGVGRSGAGAILTQGAGAPSTIKTSDGTGTGDFTVVLFANPPAEAALTEGFSQYPGGNPRTDFFLNSSGASATSGSFEFWVTGAGLAVAGAIDGNYHLFAGRRGEERQVWVDGVKRASNGTVGQDIWISTSSFGIGSRADGNFPVNTATNIVFAAGWNRALSDAEMRMLARDPFRMVRLNRPVVVKAPAAGGGFQPAWAANSNIVLNGAMAL